MKNVKYLALALTISMLIVGLVPILGSGESSGTELTTLSSGRLVIDGNADLDAQASSKHWPGDGSASDPYVISGLNIVSDENLNAIDIRNVSSHLLLDGCSVSPIDQQGIEGGSFSCGISLQNVSNAVINGTAINGFTHGVMISECSNLIFSNGTVINSVFKGIRAVYSDRLTFDNNTITNCGDSGLESHSSSRLLVQYNNITYHGQAGLNFWLPITDSIIRWNLVSMNGMYGFGNALYISGTGNTIYGNVLVSSGGEGSEPAGCGYGAINEWSSPEGAGNYYGANYDIYSQSYTSFLGEPICSSQDENGDGISDEPYTIPCYSDPYEGGPEVDDHPLIVPAAPPRNLMATVGSNEVSLSWKEPSYFTDPLGHYLLARNDGSSVQEIEVAGTSYTDIVDDVDSWTSIRYTVSWVGKNLVSGPSAYADARNPDRPMVRITSELGVHAEEVGGTFVYTNSTLDPLSVLVEWVGEDSDSASMDYQVKLDDGEWISVSGVSNHTFYDLAEGMHTVTVRAMDDDSNQVEDTRTFYVRQVARMSYSCLPSLGDGEPEMTVSGVVKDAASGDVLADLPLVLLYSTQMGQSWDAKNTVTGDDGSFRFTIDIDTGAIMGLVLTASLIDHYGAEHAFFQNETYVAMDLDGRDGIFLARSTSRLSNFQFSSEMMSFNITGEDGTIGVTSILIPKSGMDDVNDIRIFMDGTNVDYDLGSEGDYWVLTFVYAHSSHEVKVDLGSTGSNLTVILIVVALLAVVGVVAAVLVLRRRKKN